MRVCNSDEGQLKSVNSITLKCASSETESVLQSTAGSCFVQAVLTTLLHTQHEGYTDSSYYSRNNSTAYLQKKRKYGAVVSMMKTAKTSSISVRQLSLSSGMKSIITQEHRNITREGAVICICESIM